MTDRGDSDRPPDRKEDTAKEAGEDMADGREVRVEEEATQNYAQLELMMGESICLQCAPQPASGSALAQPGNVPDLAEPRERSGLTPSKSHKHEPRSKKPPSSSYTYTYASGSSQRSRRSLQVELTQLQIAMLEEKRKLGELQERSRMGASVKELREERYTNYNVSEQHSCLMSNQTDKERQPGGSSNLSVPTVITRSTF